MEAMLEIPVSEREAKERGINPGLARLVFASDDRGDGDAHSLWRAIELCRPSSASGFVHPIGGFTSIESLAKKLEQQHERFSFFPQLQMASISSGQDGTELLRAWHAEQLVIFFGSESSARKVIGSLPSLTEKWWHLTNEGPEAAYLKQLDECDPFFFFSETRSSVEVLGSRRQVLACFDKIRSLISET